jgi:ABC-type multidrug transport system ATPase subunit
VPILVRANKLLAYLPGVNIGLELAAQPNVLFLDEPTSGLDATSSLAVVLSLKKMSQLGT